MIDFDFLGVKELIKTTVLLGLYGVGAGLIVGAILGRGKALIAGVATCIFCVAAKVGAPHLVSEVPVSYVPMVIAMPASLIISGVLGRLVSAIWLVAIAVTIVGLQIYG